MQNDTHHSRLMLALQIAALAIMAALALAHDAARHASYASLPRHVRPPHTAFAP